MKEAATLTDEIRAQHRDLAESNEVASLRQSLADAKAKDLRSEAASEIVDDLAAGDLEAAQEKLQDLQQQLESLAREMEFAEEEMAQINGQEAQGGAQQSTSGSEQGQGQQGGPGQQGQGESAGGEGSGQGEGGGRRIEGGDSTDEGVTPFEQPYAGDDETGEGAQVRQYEGGSSQPGVDTPGLNTRVRGQTRDLDDTPSMDVRGVGPRNEASTPYYNVQRPSRAEVESALDRQNIPASERPLVQDYFNEID